MKSIYQLHKKEKKNLLSAFCWKNSKDKNFNLWEFQLQNEKENLVKSAESNTVSMNYDKNLPHCKKYSICNIT